MPTNILTPLANQITSIAGSIAATGQLISKCSLSEEKKEFLLLNISERLKLIQMLTDARPEERSKTLEQVEEEIQVIINKRFEL